MSKDGSTSGGLRARFGLTARMLVLLTIALVPVGMIALGQTRQLQTGAVDGVRQSLELETAHAASLMRQRLERTIGVAYGLAEFDEILSTDTEVCSAPFRSLTERSRYLFSGMIRLDGRAYCTSTGTELDFAAEIADGQLESLSAPQITVNEEGLISGAWVVIVTVPVVREGANVGVISISMPYEDLVEPAEGGQPVGGGVTMLTFNELGEMITRQSPVIADVTRAIPEGLNPQSWLADGNPPTFIDRDQDGVERAFAVTDILEGRLYAVGIFDTAQVASITGPLPAVTFPLLMLLASFGVAYFAVNRVVLRHIRSLGRGMRRFATNRTLPPDERRGEVPSEIAAIKEDFRDMAEVIVRDEALLRRNIQEKGVLLKEVHHRVKNNLQLISSIMSLQMRGLEDHESRAIVARLQDRILSLAAIHSLMYLSEDMLRVKVGSLLEEIVDQHTYEQRQAGSLEVRQSYDEIDLFPVQAVPIALLTAEALANAVQRLTGRDDVIEVSLTTREDGEGAKLRIENRRVDVDQTELPRRGGLGRNLMEAFANQLNGTLVQEPRGDRYLVEVAFEIVTEMSPGQDY